MATYRGVVGLSNQAVIVLCIDLEDGGALGIQAGTDSWQSCQESCRDGRKSGVMHVDDAPRSM